ncbi:MAG: hypothetical protein ACI9L6_001156 [Flavobacterium sp.]|jgi:hypothetical protein
MRPIYHYSDVSEALDSLTKMGFTYDYNIHEHEIENTPHIHEVKQMYRYEDISDSGDSAIVYKIMSTSGKKGVFDAGFSANTNRKPAAILDKIYIEGSKECEI